jgi:hypothetical protein
VTYAADPRVDAYIDALPDGSKPSAARFAISSTRPTTRLPKRPNAIDLGEPVLLLIRDFGRLEGSKEEVQGNHAAVWTVRDRKITRAEFYADHNEALEAMGLAK